MEKNQIIKEVSLFLQKFGIDQGDYIVSLQGPTFIFTAEGSKKLNESIRDGVSLMGALIL
jgi:hypothetical protein